MTAVTRARVRDQNAGQDMTRTNLFPGDAFREPVINYPFAVVAETRPSTNASQVARFKSVAAFPFPDVDPG